MGKMVKEAIEVAADSLGKVSSDDSVDIFDKYSYITKVKAPTPEGDVKRYEPYYREVENLLNVCLEADWHRNQPYYRGRKENHKSFEKYADSLTKSLSYLIGQFEDNANIYTPKLVELLDLFEVSQKYLLGYALVANSIDEHAIATDKGYHLEKAIRALKEFIYFSSYNF